MEVNRGSSKCRGFTILEVLITISVAAILLGSGVPALQSFIANNQVTATNNSIVEGLNLARFTAVTSGDEVVICPSADESACTGDKWSEGWIVFGNADGNGTPAAAERIRVRTQTGNLVVSQYSGNIVFESDGTTSLSSAANIKVCYKNSDVTTNCRTISVSPFGVISSSKTTS